MMTPMPRGRSYDHDQDETGTRSCSRHPPELCDSARLVVQDDGTTRREPGLTPRAFCDPCQSRIVSCLDELPYAYVRLAEAIGDPVRAGTPVRRPPGSRVLIAPEIDALMRLTATVLAGWAARVRRVPGLQLADPEHPYDTAAGVREACGTLAAHPTPLLGLPPKWATRTFTYPTAPAEVRWLTTCRHCGRPVSPGQPPAPGQPPRWWLAEPGAAPSCDHQPADPTPPGRPDIIPDTLLAAIGDHEIIRQGDGWLDIQLELDGADAGNETIDLHYRARRILGETRPPRQLYDGVPCRNCEAMGSLERAEPPSDPNIPANHSRCAECRDEMSREEFDFWAERYATWARGAGVQVCRRCSVGLCLECSWSACSCDQGEHPRRRAVA